MKKLFLALLSAVILHACTKQDTIDIPSSKTDLSKLTKEISKISNNDLRQIANDIINTSHAGLGQDLVTAIGTPMWNKSLSKGELQKQWFIPFTLDNQSVNAVMIIEKINSKYRYLVISALLYKGKIPELNAEKKLLLAYFNHQAFGKQTLAAIRVDKHNKFPLTIHPVTNTLSRWEENCVSGNVFCNCPSSWAECDMCEECMGTYCYSYWVASPEDELEEYDPSGPGGGSGGGSNPYELLSSQLNNILSPGDSYYFSSTLNHSTSLIFSSVSQFQDYLANNAANQSSDLSELPTIINQNEKIEHGKFNLTFIGGVDVSCKMSKSGNTWSLINVTSTDYGVTIGWQWDQSDFAQSTSGSEITLNVEGYVRYNIIFDGWGTVYKQKMKFQLKINTSTGKITSLAKL